MAEKYRDYNFILPGKLAQGAYPGNDVRLFNAFDVVVYMALASDGGQPRIPTPHGKAVFRCPIDDNIYQPPTPQELAAVHQTSQQVARAVRGGAKALVTCIQGKNRSGLVTALSLLYLYPSWTPQQAIALIRRNRKLGPGEYALMNPIFERIVLTHR